MSLTKQELQKLRNEIVLNSIYTNDYTNTFNIHPRQVQDFFDGWLEECSATPLDDNDNTLNDLNLSYNEYYDKLFELATNIDELYTYYIYMFDEDPLSQKFFEKYYK
jgi:hypothetical protein